MSTPEALLLKMATEGGCIVSSGECSVMEIAMAQACNRFAVVDSLGFVLRQGPKESTKDKPIA